MWSHAALAALMAELSFLAAMTAAPRFCTFGRKVFCSHASSPITCGAGRPPIEACDASGNWVLLWLPQMMAFFTEEMGTPDLRASCAVARFWSSLKGNRIIAMHH